MPFSTPKKQKRRKLHLSIFSSTKKIFKALDVDNTGSICLQDIIRASKTIEQLDLETIRSLIVLKSFDTYQDGRLNYEEFEALIDYAKDIRRQERHDRIKESFSKLFSCCSSRNKATADHSARVQIVYQKPVKRILGSRTTNIAAVPEFKAPISPEEAADFSLVGDFEDSDTDSFHLAFSESSSEKSDLEDFKTKVITESLMTQEGRTDYINWLFRAADVDENKSLTVDELGIILDAVEADGIDPAALTSIKSLETLDRSPWIEITDEEGELRKSLDYDSILQYVKDKEKLKIVVKRPKDNLARAVMDEYDTNYDGALNQEEFTVLAHLIVDEYIANASWAGAQLRQVGPWILSRSLGYGSEGAVKYAVHEDTGVEAAVKIVPKSSLNRLRRIDNEIAAYQKLDIHPNILSLFQVIDSEEYIFLVLDLAGGGSLLDFIISYPFDEAVIKYFFKHIVDVLLYCHNAGICHRDLRLENILLDSQGEIKLTDFGHSESFKKGWDLFSDPPGSVGTIDIVAPEMLNNQVYIGTKVDIWALGVMLYTMVCHEKPFYDRDEKIMLQNISEYKLKEVPDIISQDCRDIIKSLLEPDPAKRITLEELLKNPWFAGTMRKPAMALAMIELDKSLIETDPKLTWETITDIFERIGARVSSRETTANHTVTALFTATITLQARVELKFVATLGDDAKIRFRLLRGTGWDFQRVFRKINHKIRSAFDVEMPKPLPPVTVEVGTNPDGEEGPKN